MSKELNIFLIWLCACSAMFGSLFFSEVMAYPPCTLCWYQRICMYPLVVILIPAIFKFEKSILKYTLPLTTIGLFVAIYHNFIYYGLIDESLSPCQLGVSCKAVFMSWLGFVDIPQMSLFAFSLIFILQIIIMRSCTNEK